MHIEKATEEELLLFLRLSQSSKQTFTYYHNRPINIIRNHISTLLGYTDNNPVCYGHLDPDKGKVWLGICVADPYIGQGFGKKMMVELIKEAVKNRVPTINLSVQKQNVIAIELYKKFGFKTIKETEKNKFMELYL